MQLFRQALDAILDDLLDRRRQGARRDLGLSGKGPLTGGVALDAARVHERTHELLHEEGVAFGAVEDAGHRAVVELALADQGLQEEVGLRAGERSQPQGLAARVSVKAGQDLVQGVLAVDLRRAVGADDEGKD